MTITITMEDHYTLVKIHANFDACLALEAHDLFDDLIKNASRNVILDLDEAEQLDSSGIGAIVFLFKRLRVLGFSLELRELQEQPFRLIKRLHINKVIKVSTKIPIMNDSKSLARN